MLGATKPLFLTVAFAYFATAGVVAAQSAGPDEAVMPNGSVTQEFALTPEQRNAIYMAISGQGLRTSTTGFAEAIGAPVPPSVELDALPEQAAVSDSGEPLLEYAMVEDDILLVDPVSMRVIDVIHGSAKP